MTSNPIAGAARAGKSAYDRAAILRSAHALARQRLANNRAWRSYRHAFADALRREWYAAKMARARAEIEAEDANAIELPEDVRAECAALRLQASCLPFGCTRNYRELNDEARAIEEAARAEITERPTPQVITLPDAKTIAMQVDARSDFSLFGMHRKGQDVRVTGWGDVILIAKPFEGEGCVGYHFTYPADFGPEPPEGEPLPLAA